MADPRRQGTLLVPDFLHGGAAAVARLPAHPGGRAVGAPGGDRGRARLAARATPTRLTHCRYSCGHVCFRARARPLREPARGGRDPRLGLRARAAGGSHRPRLQHLRPRVRGERRRARRPRDGEVRRAAVGRAARWRRRLHRTQRHLHQRPEPAQQAAPAAARDHDRERRGHRGECHDPAGDDDRYARHGRRGRRGHAPRAGARRGHGQPGKDRRLRGHAGAPEDRAGRGVEARAAGRGAARAARVVRGPARDAVGGRDPGARALRAEPTVLRGRGAGQRGARGARAPEVPAVPGLRARIPLGDRGRRTHAARSRPRQPGTGARPAAAHLVGPVPLLRGRDARGAGLRSLRRGRLHPGLRRVPGAAGPLPPAPSRPSSPRPGSGRRCRAATVSLGRPGPSRGSGLPRGAATTG